MRRDLGFDENARERLLKRRVRNLLKNPRLVRGEHSGRTQVPETGQSNQPNPSLYWETVCEWNATKGMNYSRHSYCSVVFNSCG